MFNVVCHYAEIGLKGKNRKFFEEKLVSNIKKALQKGGVKRISGRILIELDSLDGVKEGLLNVFGIANFAFASSSSQNIEEIKKKALEILEKESFSSFKINCSRSNKDFSLTSVQVNEKVGEFIVSSLAKKVNLTSPDLTLFIEIVDNYCFLFLEKLKGLGGLPVGISGKAVSLISGGIDSPVASFYAMKRGIELVFCHFHSFPFTDKASLEKVIAIVKILTKYQFESKLYLIPFASIQKEILLKTKEKLRVLLYRRFMFKIAQEIAQKEKARVLITGESVGQVASQTLPNMQATEEAVSIPNLKPVVGQDKEEIIQKAKEIGTFQLSIQPYNDCCSRFLPKHPETNANLEEVKREENKLDSEELIKRALKQKEICIIKTQP